MPLLRRREDSSLSAIRQRLIADITQVYRQQVKALL